MRKSKTNRRVNKSSDHGKCYCYKCDVEKSYQYIKKKYPTNKKALSTELNMYNLDDDIILDYEMKGTYGM